MINFIVRTVFTGEAVFEGGQVVTILKTFKGNMGDILEMEDYLKYKDIPCKTSRSYQSRQLIGIELLPDPIISGDNKTNKEVKG